MPLVLRPGSRAARGVLDAPSYAPLAYRPWVPLVRSVVKDGRLLPIFPG